MNDQEVKVLALDLLHAESEHEVIQILKARELWDDNQLWRLYGDKEGNFATVGNQQNFSEAALIEKIVNSVDSTLMAECLKKGIQPESENAPRGIREAVKAFFDEPGMLIDWPETHRTQQARAMVIPPYLAVVRSRV